MVRLREIKYLISNGAFHIQWLPSHCGINGNHVADQAAKLGLTQNHIEQLPASESILKKIIRNSTSRYWSAAALAAISSSHLGRIREDTNPQPWVRSSSRRLDTAITRLRIGHSSLNAHLHRIGVVDDPACEWCGQDDTIHHFIFVCPRHHSERITLQDRLNKLNISFNEQNLLGGGPHEENIKRKIMRFFKIFIHKSSRLGNI